MSDHSPPWDIDHRSKLAYSTGKCAPRHNIKKWFTGSRGLKPIHGTPMCEELGSVVLTSVRTTSCCIKRNIIHWAHTHICGSILSPSSRSVLFMSNLSRPQTGATRRPIGAAERSSEYYTFPFWLSLLRPRWSRSTRLVEALRSMAGTYRSRKVPELKPTGAERVPGIRRDRCTSPSICRTKVDPEGNTEGRRYRRTACRTTYNTM